MKRYTCKTLEECLEEASKELNIPTDSLVYTIEEEKKSLFSKKVTISVAEVLDIIEYCENYIVDICHGLGFEVSLKSIEKDNFIKIFIETNHNSLLIGKNGTTLNALNDVVRLAASNKFQRKIHVLLDISGYKDKKYNRVVFVAKQAAKEVLKTHLEIKLEPMTADERKKVHNALTTWKNISSESVGDGRNRAIVIKYKVSNDSPTTSNTEEVVSSSEDVKEE